MINSPSPHLTRYLRAREPQDRKHASPALLTEPPPDPAAHTPGSQPYPQPPLPSSGTQLCNRTSTQSPGQTVNKATAEVGDGARRHYRREGGVTTRDSPFHLGGFRAGPAGRTHLLSQEPGCCSGGWGQALESGEP